MALLWQPWTDAPPAAPANGRRSPYVDWYLATDLRDLQARPYAFVSQEPLRDSLSVLHGRPDAGAGATTRPWAGPFLPGVALPDLPLPRRAVPTGATALVPPQDRPDPRSGLSVLPAADDVIIGVIDAGVAPGHERLRRRGGAGSRVLSHWAQSGRWQDQRHLPFGRETMQREIDAALSLQDGDEDALNRRLGLVDYADPDSERWIDGAAPHGMAVADLAAGCDPMAQAGARLRDRAHLVTVELASRIAIGPSGCFLEFYALWAIRHIVTTADAIWRACHPDHPRRGFPVVINLSYGVQAGPKDGSMAIQRLIDAMNSARDPAAPVRVVLPAGNDNLDRCAATLAARPRGGASSVIWRVLPEDRSSSCVEIWADPVRATSGAGGGSDGAAVRNGASHPGFVSVAPPAGPALAFGATLPRPGQTCDLVDTAAGDAVVARVYCTAGSVPAAGGGAATGYVLCVAPTWRPARAAAPSGAWRITLGQGPSARLYVQSDQRVTPGDASPLLAYFDDSPDTPAPLRYRMHAADGRLRDTYGIDPVTGAVTDAEPPASTGPVRRRNTLNAIAGGRGAITIAGYRASDGWPSDYSASARGGAQGPHIDAACIADDGIWHGGRLAAGGRSGSVAVVQGTSFATAEATRVVALMMLDWLDAGATGPGPADAKGFRLHAILSDARLCATAMAGGATLPPIAELPDKLGAGRLLRQSHGRPAR